MALSQQDVVSRESLIDRLRQELLRLAGDDQSICRMAAERATASALDRAAAS